MTCREAHIWGRLSFVKGRRVAWLDEVSRPLQSAGVEVLLESTMQVGDIPPDQEELYCQCLEEWSDEMKNAGSMKGERCRLMKSRGPRVKVSLDERGAIGGMIQYRPIENAAILGKDLYYVYRVISRRIAMG